MSNSSIGVRRAARDTAGRCPPLEHAIVDTDDTIECTIFPCECTDEEILTHWITANGTSFVSLEEMR